MNEEPKKCELKIKKNQFGAGTVVGLVLGVALWSPPMKNSALGLTLGIAMGVLLGLSIGKLHEESRAVKTVMLIYWIFFIILLLLGLVVLWLLL